MLPYILAFALFVSIKPTVALAPAEVAIAIEVDQPTGLEGQSMCVYISGNDDGAWRSSCWPFIEAKRTNVTIKNILAGNHRIRAALNNKQSNIVSLEVH